jgi:hypothetical protein
MKIKQNVTLYQCEFCKKSLQIKHAMEFHEKWCTKNPVNFRACFECPNKMDASVDVYRGMPYDPEASTSARTFQCSVTHQLMYAPKAEKKGLIEKYPDTFEDQVRMPEVGKCEHQPKDEGFNPDLY